MMRVLLAWLTASVLGASPIHAATVRMGPEPETVNTASFAGTFGGLRVPYRNVHVVGSSHLVVTFDPATRALSFDAISLQHGSPTAILGPSFGFCLQNVVFRLPAGSPPPRTTTDAGGHFTISFDVTMEYGFSPASTRCFTFVPGSLTATWDVTGTVTVDAITGRTRLTDTTVTVSHAPSPGEVVNVLVDGAMTLNFWDGFGLTEPPAFQLVGRAIALTGNDITPGSVLKVFVNTPGGVIDVIPAGLAPTATTPSTWESVLPFPWPVTPPDDVELGFGFMQVHLVRTDRGHDRSNGISRVLLGNEHLGVPSIAALGTDQASSLAESSWSPEVATANVEVLLVPGQSYYVGTGNIEDQDPVLNIFSAAGNCAPAGGLLPSERGFSFLRFTLPVACPTGPGAFEVINRRNGRASNIVSAPLGALIRIDAVDLTGRSVHVTGAGFSALTVVNLFATRQDTADTVNLGGLSPGGQPRIPLTSVTATSFTFELPSHAAAGAAFVEALNPPFIPFTSSRVRSQAGGFAIP